MRSFASLAVAPMAIVIAAVAVENLPLVGSSGGNSFTRDCPANHVLSGIRYRRGLVLDAVGIKCRPIRNDGTLGSEISVGTMTGGNGGTAGSESCPSNTAIVSQAGASQGGVGVGILVLGCFEWFPASRSWGGSRLTHLAIKTGGALPALVTSTCSSGSQPATGIRGRHGSVVDSFGLRCNTP
jgi:hypothetical protein